METKHEDKATKVVPTISAATCPQRRSHKLLTGGTCATCGMNIPAGPYSPAEFKTYFAETVVSPSVDPAVAANPPSPELLAAEVEAERAGEAVQQAASEVTATNLAVQRLRGVLSNDIDSAMVTLRIPAGVEGRANQIAALRDRQRDEEAEVDRLQKEHGKALLQVNALRQERDARIRAAMAGLPAPATRGQRFVEGLRNLIGS